MTGGFMSDLMTITSSDSIGSGPENEERGNWRGKLEFILSCLGYVVGLGNIWRFPYLVYRNGGGAFFIPYFVMVTLCGIPLVYMEMAFGQYASLGPVTIWRACPIFKGVGYAMVVTVAIICVYYNIVNAWALHYLFSSFSASLPWASCDNPWNTDACRLNRYEVTNCSLVNATYILSSDTENDNCSQYLLDCMHATNQSAFPKENTTVCIEWLEDQHGEAIYLPERQSLMATLKDPSADKEVLNISDGLHEMGGVQWQLALYLLLCWVIVFLCLVAYFVVIIPIVILVVLLICSMLVDGHLEGIRFYVTPKWDHFLSFRVWSDAASQVFFSLSACSGGLTTLSNIGLVFVAFPAAVTNFQPSAMWSAFFFLMIIMMGMSSLLVMTEIIVTVMMDEKVEVFRKSRILVLLVVCSLLYLLGLPLTTRGATFLQGHPADDWSPCLLVVAGNVFILVSTIVSGVDLEDEVYPAWAEGLGIVLVTSTVITIPIYAIKKVSSLEGSIMQRIHRVDFSTNDVRAPKLSEASLLSLTRQMSPRKPQQLRQRAILNHAYSNPQCHISNGSLDQVKPHQQEAPLPQTHGYTLIVSPRRSTVVPGVDVATQTDARSFTLALKHGSVRSLKEMKIETGPEVEGRGKHPSSVLHNSFVNTTSFPTYCDPVE
ncbi:SC6A9-like protein [Mya arenaria]|uniref:Transporter n=1 Tax=Mya arenaria TaxID=6604 RepID=A0ABY7DTD2_MYAAR|nr:SC6A9-like protein [Mya arenaria]